MQPSEKGRGCGAGLLAALIAVIAGYTFLWLIAGSGSEAITAIASSWWMVAIVAAVAAGLTFIFSPRAHTAKGPRTVAIVLGILVPLLAAMVWGSVEAAAKGAREREMREGAARTAEGFYRDGFPKVDGLQAWADSYGEPKTSVSLTSLRPLATVVADVKAKAGSGWKALDMGDLHWLAKDAGNDRVFGIAIDYEFSRTQVYFWKGSARDHAIRTAEKFADFFTDHKVKEALAMLDSKANRRCWEVIKESKSIFKFGNGSYNRELVNYSPVSADVDVHLEGLAPANLHCHLSRDGGLWRIWDLALDRL